MRGVCKQSRAIRVDFIKLILSISSSWFPLDISGMTCSRCDTYSLVQMDSVLAGNDIGDGGTGLLGRLGLLRLGLGVVLRHCEGCSG